MSPLKFYKILLKLKEKLIISYLDIAIEIKKKELSASGINKQDYLLINKSGIELLGSFERYSPNQTLGKKNIINSPNDAIREANERALVNYFLLLIKNKDYAEAEKIYLKEFANRNLTLEYPNISKAQANLASHFYSQKKEELFKKCFDDAIKNYTHKEGGASIAKFELYLELLDVLIRDENWEEVVNISTIPDAQTIFKPSKDVPSGYTLGRKAYESVVLKYSWELFKAKYFLGLFEDSIIEAEEDLSTVIGIAQKMDFNTSGDPIFFLINLWKKMDNEILLKERQKQFEIEQKVTFDSLRRVAVVSEKKAWDQQLLTKDAYFCENEAREKANQTTKWLGLVAFISLMLVLVVFFQYKKIKEASKIIAGKEEEMNHRVTNNLKLLTAYTSEMTDWSHSIDAKKALKKMQSIVGSMMKTHGLLKELKFPKNLSLAIYLEDIISAAKQSCNIYNLKPVKSEIENLSLNAKSAVAIGRIITELFYNARKHAFPDELHPEIQISLKQKENQYELLFSNNGRRLPEDFDFEQLKKSSYGMGIIDMNRGQVKGDIFFINKTEGSTVRLVFP